MIFQPLPGAAALPMLPMPPWRLSGVVVGVLMNDPAALAALGDAASQPPYKAPPRAPVLYVKPRNTLAGSGSTVVVPGDAGAFQVGASLGLVVGRTACRLAPADAMAHLAGVTLVADLSVPHDSFYRPSVRHKARDGSCVIGPQVWPLAAVGDVDALSLQVRVDGQAVHSASTTGRLRPAMQLLCDVSDFMTLHPGDILLLGVAHGAPLARAGQSFEVRAEGLGSLAGRLVAEAAGEAGTATGARA